MTNIVEDTWNFVFNICELDLTNDGYNIINKNKKINFFEIHEIVDIEIRKAFNIKNIKDLFKEKEAEFVKYGGCYCAIIKIYTEINSVLKDPIEDKNKEKLALILFNSFIKKYKGNLDNIFENYNKIIARHNLYYENNLFSSLEPIFITPQINEAILNLSKAEKEKYNTVIVGFKESFNLYSEMKYSLSITKSFSALESLVKTILEEKSFKINNSFISNIKLLIDNDFFNGFNVESYFSGLACIRNSNSAHGDIEQHKEDKLTSYFYIYNIGNCIVYLIKKSSLGG